MVNWRKSQIAFLKFNTSARRNAAREKRLCISANCLERRQKSDTAHIRGDGNDPE